jgi:hypothetical protein
MQCEGYNRAAHEVPSLYGRGPLCESCYMRKYRAEHVIELQKYQREYRADSAYGKAARIYMREYRKRG